MRYKHKRIAFISVALSLSIVIGVAAQSVVDFLEGVLLHILTLVA